MVSFGRLPEPVRRDPVAYLVELRQTLPRVTDAAQIPPRLTLAGQVAQLPNLLVGDFRTVGAQIPDNSVALVLTDPPYDRKSLPLYGDVAAFAARVLVPGGSLVVYAPTYALPEVCGMMADHLRFWWAFALVHTGRRALMRGHGVRVAWKPLLWFTKGERTDTRIVEDVIRGTPEKTVHPWQQGVVEAATLIESLTRPGDCVCDPMVGSGTTLLAARLLGRRGIGIEINPDTAALAARRLAEGDGGLQTQLCGVLS
ncbi:MAG: site-specific DNA-methyltransferase [Armatimonadota bacterium]|nr:site-specific DNA-methyltransferase [Armatimonadota bacterium]